MKILILLGSPRKKGNSTSLAQAVGAAAAERGAKVQEIRLNDLHIRPCQGCGGCDKNGICTISDDMTPLYAECDSAERIVLASPIYFYGLSAQAKLFADRMQAQWARRYLLRQRLAKREERKGYLLAAAATNGAQLFDAAILTTKYILDAMDCRYGGELLVRGVDECGAVEKRVDVMAEAEEFGRRLAEDGRESWEEQDNDSH